MLRNDLLVKGRKLIGDQNLAYDGVPCAVTAKSNELSERVQPQVYILDTPNPLAHLLFIR